MKHVIVQKHHHTQFPKKIEPMEEKSRIESMAGHIRTYLETQWELFILNTSDKASGIISSIASVALIAVSMIFVLLFLSIGAAIWIGHSYGDSSVGFLYIGLFYLLVTIVLFAFRKSLIKLPVINSILNALHTNERD
jgi:hypothetical protein